MKKENNDVQSIVDDTTNSLWKVEQEILDVIDQVCMKNDLRYSLAYGTLLGAVRHKDFIPWDDDIDIMMPREDYNRLLNIWEKEAPNGYIIQDYNHDLDYTNNFAKVRKDHTTFLHDESEAEKKYHKGIFVDIFPADYVAEGNISRVLQYIACAINLLYSRGYSSRSGGMIGIIESILLHFPKKFFPEFRRLSEQYICKYNKKGGKYIFLPCTIVCCKKYFPGDMFEELQKVDFHEKEYLAVKNTDKVLRIQYGDYMKLPPKEERVRKHHPVLIDFEHNYEEIVRVDKNYE